MKRVIKLIKQNSKWEITTTHLFTHRFYEVDEIGNFYRNGKHVIVKPDKRNNIFVFLIDDNGVKIRCKIHQLVYQTYSDNNIKNYYSVDHINRLKRLDNSISNLRLASRTEQYANRDNLSGKTKKIKCINNDAIYNSCQEAEIKLGLVKNTVCRVARGERKSIHGYNFKFI